MVNCYIFS